MTSPLSGRATATPERRRFQSGGQRRQRRLTAPGVKVQRLARDERMVTRVAAALLHLADKHIVSYNARPAKRGGCRARQADESSATTRTCFRKSAFTQIRSKG